MPLTMHSASVPLLTQMLTALSGVLKKAESHAAARRIEPSVLLEYRLAADMFPLRRQVQIACDFAKGTAGRLAGIERCDEIERLRDPAVPVPRHDRVRDPSPRRRRCRQEGLHGRALSGSR